MKFLGNVLATVTGLFIFCMMFFFGFLILAAIFGGGDEKVVVKDDSVIEFKLENISNDYGGKYSDPWISLFSEGQNIGVMDVVKALHAAAHDDQIKGISILNNVSEIGVAQAKALRDALLDFKKSGKFIVAYSHVYTQKEYYLASAADTIYLNPVGEMDFRGLSAELMFYKDLQEKTGVKMEVIRHGKFKSAVEPFLENKMSDANRLQLSTLLGSVWHSVLTDISTSRNISATELNNIADNLSARTPEGAKVSKLIDRIAYEDQYHAGIRRALKTDKDEKDYNKISITDYAQKVKTSPQSSSGSDKIAVIYAQGEITGGEGDVSYIGEGSICRSLLEARKDKNVKAVVLRVDSPGGSALVSDLIWREVGLTKKAKPVVVSMGNLAASGGYYISCNANTIFAEESTITGSIGVFGMLPNFTELSNKIGIHTEVVGTNKNAAPYSPFRPLDANTRAVTLESIEQIYSTFVQHVAEGRHMTAAQVDSIGQGRVWSGRDAIRIGLVDKIGGLDDAMIEAAKLGKTKKYRTVNYPEYKKDFNELLSGALPFAKTKESILKAELGDETYQLMQKLKEIKSQKGIQARMPFTMTFN